MAWLTGASRTGARTACNAAAFCLFLTWMLVVGTRHEPWFDEAQAWLIARDNTPWSLLTNGVRYEGTPALWHLLLWCAQRLGLPYQGLFLISAALGAGGAWIVLYRSPFPAGLRLGVIFSYFFAYQYSIVARSYALDLLFIPWLASRFEQRLQRPLAYAAILALIANTNAHSFMLSGVLALELAWCGRARLLALDPRLLIAMLLYGLFALAAAAQAFPPSDINFIIRKPGDAPLIKALELAAEAFVERVDIFSFAPPSSLSRLGGAFITLLILAPALALFVKARRLVLALALFGALIGFSAVKYGNFWHAGIIFLAFVFSLWVSWGALGALRPLLRRWLTLSLATLLLVQVWDAAAASWLDLIGVYSPAAEVARVLQVDRSRRPGLTLGVAGFKAFAVQPYFPGNLFANYEGGAPRPAYYLWRRAQSPIPGLNEVPWRATAASGYDELLLSSFNLMGLRGPSRYSRDARRAGYCPKDLFKGALIWKTYTLETDDMMLYARCPSAPSSRESGGEPPTRTGGAGP